MKLFIILTFLFLTVIPPTSAPASDTEEDYICFMGIDKDQDGGMSFQEFIPVYGNDKKNSRSWMMTKTAGSPMMIRHFSIMKTKQNKMTKENGIHTGSPCPLLARYHRRDRQRHRSVFL